MNTKNKKVYFKYFFIIVVWGFLATLLVLGLFGNYTIENKPVKYAMGQVTHIRSGTKYRPKFEYEFYVNNNMYSNIYDINYELENVGNDSLSKYIGKIFFVKFNEENPKINRLMLEHPVWKNLEQPPEGWDELPNE
jgi:hypothetical protein